MIPETYAVEIATAVYEQVRELYPEEEEQRRYSRALGDTKHVLMKLHGFRDIKALQIAERGRQEAMRRDEQDLDEFVCREKEKPNA